MVNLYKLLWALFLTGIFVACPRERVEYECPDIEPEPPTKVAQTTGFLNAPNGPLFYWLVHPAQNEPSAPVAVWLNGGPGSSSLIGFFYENGPYRINPDLTIYEDPYSWHENSYVLYVDQPVGAGFSKHVESDVQNQEEVSQNMLAALKDFFGNKHPNLAGRDFYIFGESFAGTYIPWITKAILTDNQTAPNKIQLRGIAIGDGTLDRLATTQTMAEYAFKNGLINDYERYFIDNHFWPQCQAEVLARRESKRLEDPLSCREIDSIVFEAAANVNVYDYRAWGEYELRPLECYLNKPKVRQALGVGDLKWTQSNNTVFYNLTGDAVMPTVPQVIDALRAGIRVLIYTGDKDILIHHLGTELTVEQMAQGQWGEWPNRTQFAGAGVAELRDSTNRLAGRVKTGGNLTFMLIHDAGHLVPMDQPEIAKRMFDRFISNQPMVP